MTSSDDEQHGDENPMLARHRKEKKELRAKLLGMKKASKSGSKQKQKEVKEEMEKMEKELEEKHRQELADAAKATEGASESTPSEVPMTVAPESEEVVKKDGEEEASESDSDEGCSSSFYKKLTISSKNAKKQAKKKEAADKLKAAQAADKDAAKRIDTDRAMEKAAVKKMLSEDHLTMIDIPADGECMFNAIAHQLQDENIEISSRKLRERCAKHMRENKDAFAPFVSDQDVADAKPGVDSVKGGDKTKKGAGPSTKGGSTSKEAAGPSSTTEGDGPSSTGSDSSNSGWETYLFGVAHPVDKGGIWGGELELKAISQIYEKVIVVYRQSGRYRIGEEFALERSRPLRIVYLQKLYHLGEHYNSTCVI